MDKEQKKTTIDFSKIIYNMKGEATKDLIDVDENTDPKKAPDLTIGSLMMNGSWIISWRSC